MINLLPSAEKEKLQLETSWKLTIILGIIVLAVLICFILILFSIKTYISGGIEAQKIFLDLKEKDFENSQLKTLQKNIVEANEKLSQLDSFYKNQLHFSKITKEILNTLPQGMYLTSLSVKPLAEEQNLAINLAGFSPTREVLLELKKNLEAEKDFAEINFPTSNWVEQRNINFSATFKAKTQ